MRHIIHRAFVGLLSAFLLSSYISYGSVDHDLAGGAVFSKAFDKEKLTQIDVFLGNAQIDAAYQQMAFTYVAGSMYAFNDRLMGQLTQEAWRHSTNAISQTARIFNENTLTLSITDAYNEFYSLPVATIVPVKTVKSKSKAKQISASEASMIASLRVDRMFDTDQIGTKITTSIIVFVLGIVAGSVLLYGSHHS